MSVLTLVRHGQATFAGDRYDALSPRGVEQAKALGAWWAERPAGWTAVRHGPRRRHIDTAALVLEGAGAGPAPDNDPGLDEFAEGEEILSAAEQHAGRPMGGADAPTTAEQLTYYEAAYLAWFRGEIALGERATYGAFRARVRHWLDQLMARDERGQHTLAVTSAGVICALACEALGLDDRRWPELLRVLGNASVTEIVYSGTRCTLKSFNSTGHLPQGLGSGI